MYFRGPVKRRVRLKFFLQLVFSDFTIAQYLSKKTSSNCFPPVGWNNRASAVFVPQKMMAAFFAHFLESKFPECPDEAAPSY